MAGGKEFFSFQSKIASTETLVKNGGTAWKMVASLPSARFDSRGIGVGNGKFIITGEQLLS